ncbi:adenylate kinase [bacterium]|nr:adenylate kinase [bacterium]
MSEKKQMVFLGAPGAGKGTYAGPLSQEWGIPTISTGDILRANVKQGTDLGQEAKGYMDQGALVPDALVTKMVAGRLDEADAVQGFILDGFPRTIQQAEALDEILENKGSALSAVINIDVPRDVIIQRLTGRRGCPKCKANYNVNTNLKPKQAGICDQCSTELVQRADDNEETISKRLDVYNEQTAPLVDFYRRTGLLRSITAIGEIAEIVNMIRSAAEWNK